MEKRLYRNAEGSVHFGVNAPDGFVPCGKADANKSLVNIGKKKAWRCNICNDLHLGIGFPDPCPTCLVPNAYIEITRQEFVMVIGL